MAARRAARGHAAQNGPDGAIALEIQSRATDVLTACSFHDVTGQRTTQVVNTLRYVEQRVNSMLEIWSLEALTPARLRTRRRRARRGGGEADAPIPGPGTSRADRRALRALQGGTGGDTCARGRRGRGWGAEPRSAVLIRRAPPRLVRHRSSRLPALPAAWALDAAGGRPFCSPVGEIGGDHVGNQEQARYSCAACHDQQQGIHPMSPRSVCGGAGKCCGGKPNVLRRFEGILVNAG
jgi:hypothetical protein